MNPANGCPLRTLLTVCLLAFAWSAPVSVAQVGGEEKPRASTAHDYDRELLALNQRTLAGAYKKLAKHGAWDEAAVTFLDQMAVRFTYGLRSAIYRDVEVPAPAELVKSGQAAVDAGCADPLVAYCLGRALLDSGQLAQALPHLRNAPAGLAALNYPDLRVWFAARRLAAAEPGSAQGREAKKLAEQRLVRIACGKLEPVERREMLLTLREQMGLLERQDQVKFIERLRQQPDADAWVLDTLDGDLEIRLAWDQRGIAWAAEVTEEGWKGFFEHLQKARDRLTRAWKLAPDLPEPASTMITVAMGAGAQLEEDAMTWFDRAEAAQLDYPDAYEKMFHNLMPRWGGSHAQMYDLGLRGARSRRFDTDAPWQLVNAVRKIVADTGGNWSAVLSRPGVYNQLVEVADAYAKFHNDTPTLANWYRTFRAALAWRAERYGDARRILEGLDARAHLSAFASVDAPSPPHAVGQLCALSGAWADDVRRGETAAAGGDWAAASEAFEAARARLPKTPAATPPAAGEPAQPPEEHANANAATRWYIDLRLALFARRSGLAKGERVDCQPDPTFQGWKKVTGQWEVGEDGTLIGVKDSSYTPSLRLLEDVGARYEISGSADYTGQRRPAVLLVGGTSGNDYGYVTFHTRKVVVFFPGGSKHFAREEGDKADFVVRFENGTLTVRVADKLIVDHFALPEALRENPGVGVGAVDNDNGDGSVQFRDLKIRRLGDDPKEQVAPGPPEAHEKKP